MLTTNHFEPSDQLKPFISDICVFEANVPAGNVLHSRLLHDVASITILLSGDWRVQSNGEQISPASSLIVTGPNLTPALLKGYGKAKAACIRIRASGWDRFFNTPASGIADNTVSLCDVMHGDISKLTDLQADLAENHIFQKIQSFFDTLYAETQSKYSSIYVKKIEDFISTQTPDRASSIAKNLRISARQLERIMPHAFGFTPKTVLRRARYLQAVQGLIKNPSTGLDMHAADRFFDQAHMTREFRHFSGKTPGAFREMLKQGHSENQILPEIDVPSFANPSRPLRTFHNSFNLEFGALAA